MCDWREETKYELSRSSENRAEDKAITEESGVVSRDRGRGRARHSYNIPIIPNSCPEESDTGGTGFR